MAAGVSAARAQEGTAEVEEAAPAKLPIEIQADRLEYRDNNKNLIVTGHVEVTDGESVLRSDRMTINTVTKEIRGAGNVDIRHEGRIYTGETFNYNYGTRQGDFMDVDIYEGPWHITADTTERLDEETFLLRNATITTCRGDRPEFYVRSRETVVVRGDEMRSKHVTFYLGGLPVFWLPFAKRDLNSDRTNIVVVPGYSDRMGAFLLGSVHYRLNEMFRGVTHLDYRTERGVAVGQDLLWKDPEEDAYEGEFRVYYTDDDRPYEDEEDQAATEALVDNERYRFKLRHRQALTEADTLRVRSDYLSDPDVLEDFFDREFRYNTQPENSATLSHGEREYTATLNVNKKVNDFYTNLDRVPEFTLDVPRLRLGDTAFYIDSGNNASYLEASFADQLNRENYDSGRIDSDNKVYWYTRHFGWLNVIPRAGYAATYYSGAPQIQTVTGVATNALGEAETVETAETVDGGSEFRSVLELGCETSYKAFRVLHNEPRGIDAGLRHVFEPYGNYTLVPKPNVEPEELYQFDEIDTRDEVNDLVLGVRNKLQTKRRGRIHDLVDLDVYTIVNVDKADEELQTVEKVFFDGEFRSIDTLRVDVDGVVDLIEDDISTFNVQALYRHRNRSSAGLEYRYRRDSRDLVAGEVNLFPRRKWSYMGYARYDLEDSELEEHSHFLRHTTDCLGMGLGVREIDSEITVWAQVWLLAFPQSVAELGR